MQFKRTFCRAVAGGYTDGMSCVDDFTIAVKVLASEEGFARVGIAPAGQVAHGERFRQWLAGGCHADMDYMARNVEKRLRPELLVEGAHSVICLAVGYAPPSGAETADAFVARYARGRDYHKLLKRRCRRLIERIKQIEPAFEGRAFVDSAPVAERSLAASAGVGWIGKNGCLISPGLGSYVLLCEIFSNLAFATDGPMDSGCRDCGACMSACPTGAIIGDATVDSRRCISYQTIENRGCVDRELWPKMGDCIFGCDACQQACPHNRDLPAGDVELTAASSVGGFSPTLAEMLTWTQTDWDEATRGRSARRATLEMFIRNAVIAAGNTGDQSLSAPLESAGLRHPQLREVIEWATDRIRRRQ